MPESRAQGPGGYSEVRATAGTPHPQNPEQPAPSPAVPFTPPDISELGYGHSGGGAMQNRGGELADKISGTGGQEGETASLGEVAEVAEVAAL